MSADGVLEEGLVRLRHDAFTAPHASGSAPAAQIRRSIPASLALPEIGAAELDAASLREAFASHGCAIVRGLIPADRSIALARDVDCALAAFDAGMSGAAPSPWFTRFVPNSDEVRLGSRKFVRASGGMWAVDSPRMLETVCDLLDRSGIGDVATEFLGERPALSALKCNLRRVPLDTNSNWHQDGAFLGAGVRSLNLWLALSDCGVDAPGLDLVPRRFDDVLDTGTDGALFEWSVSPTVVDDVASETPVVRPTFMAGDALLFDHLFLHRTAIEDTMSLERYALECWMFAPSTFPEGQIPIVY